MLKRPPVIWLLDRLGICLPLHSSRRITSFRWLVFALTFVTYTSFHASRKPISVVKNVLNRNCSGLLPPAGVNASVTPHWCDWKPFDGPDSNTLLGFLDSSYLFSYAVFMYFSGMLAERMDLRYFLSLTMLCSAVFTWAFGVAFYWQIHSLAYFISVQVACGMFQAGGWPGVVAVMGYWQGSSKRGLMFGLWNSHTSVGNILGTLMASAFINYNWGLSFIVPGVFIAGVGVLNFLLLPPYPSQVGCIPLATIDGSVIEPTGSGPAASWQQERCSLLAQSDEEDDDDDDDAGAVDGVVDDAAASEPVSAEDADSDAVVTFGQALRIPGVMSFSASLFFAKLVSYTFLYWLPRYLHSAAGYDASESANLSTLFDVGGIVGGIVAGMLSDWSQSPAIVCFLLLLVAIPAMFTFQMVSMYSHALNTVMLVLVGVVVNGPYALITTAVSADLGSSLKAKAMATVTAIIDGTGSVGAALGPLLAGAVSTGNRWSHVFYMLMLSNALSMLCLVGVMRREWVEFRRRRQAVQTGISGATMDSDSA